MVHKRKKIKTQKMKKSFEYFRQWTTSTFRNECVNIIFLQYVIDQTKPEQEIISSFFTKEEDPRLRFLHESKLPVKTNRNKFLESKFKEWVQCIIVRLKGGKYAEATNLLVYLGLELWCENNPKAVYELIENVLQNLRAFTKSKGKISLTYTRHGRLAQKVQQYLYFLTHILLILFRYGLSPLPIPTSLQTDVFMVTGELLEIEQELGGSSFLSDNEEVWLEICWVLLLSKKMGGKDVVPSFNTTRLIRFLERNSSSILVPERLYARQKSFFFFHSLYHTEALRLVVAKELK